MKKQITRSLMAVLLLLSVLCSFAFAAAAPTEKEAYRAMIALKSRYPEGTSWTDEDYYAWKGGIVSGGYGSEGFAFMLSDAAFGDLPARKVETFAFEDLMVGDILFFGSEDRSVVILEKYSENLVVAEGSYNGAVHWGRSLSKGRVTAADYLYTRYPEAEHVHEYTESVVPPTCTEVGYTLHKCTYCDDEYKDTFTEALGHDWGEGIVTLAPMEKAEGVRTFTCSRCGETKTEPIPKLTPVRGITDISLTLPEKRVYPAGAEELDLTGGSFTVVYEDGGTEEVPLSADWVSGFDSSEVGEVTLSIYYGESVWEFTVSIIFEDVTDESAYYYDAVYWALDAEVTTGMTKQSFGPDSTVTRGQAVTFLWRSMGEPEPTTKENPFKDVAESDYYYKAVLWAVENGITNGTSETAFSPNDTCTCAHILTFLYRLRGRPGAAETPETWYSDAVAWAEESGLLTGIPREFDPMNDCPRAEVVTYLYREVS